MKLADVARTAGVSVTTVSRVLNGDEHVKRSTRARVQRAIEELKYYPNLHARSLAGGTDKTMGMVVSNLDNPFFLDIYRRFEALAQAEGYETVISASHYDPARLRASLRSMVGRRVAGIAAIVSEMSAEVAEELEGLKIPVVCYDFDRAGKTITNIRSNYARGMRQLVEYLHSLGHRRMAFVNYPLPLGPIEDRRRTFLATVRELGAEAHVVSMGNADGLSGGRESARQLLASGFDATAIVCVNDIIAVGVLKELHEQGLNVPGRVSIVGFDNIQLGQYTIPSLTTVDIPRERIAELAFAALVRPASTETATRDFVLEPELILRRSTGPMSAGRVRAGA